MRLLIIIFFSLISFRVMANNDSVLINALVKDIAAMQIQKDDGEFYKGMFYGFRECGGFPHNYQRDNNVFFTGITAFAFRNMLPALSDENKLTANKIISNAATSYPYFKNKLGGPFYNFWPTDAPIMPHTYYFKYLKGVFGQGEDADDSVMILMTSGNNDSDNQALKQRIIQVSNRSRKKITSTFKRYRNYPAYSTYLGFKMIPDFDFAVHCNLLYFTLDKKLAFTLQDSATVSLLAAMLENSEYKKNPIFISPYYVKPSILLYHIARLMGAFTIPQLEKYKPQLINDIRLELEKSTNIMDHIILRTSLLRLQVSAPSLGLTSIEEFEKSNQRQYIFFQARPAFSYPLPLKQIMLQASYINYYFYCPAYNKTLLLEYLVEKNKTSPSFPLRKKESSGN